MLSYSDKESSGVHEKSLLVGEPWVVLIFSVTYWLSVAREDGGPFSSRSVPVGMATD